MGLDDGVLQGFQPYRSAVFPLAPEAAGLASPPPDHSHTRAYRDFSRILSIW